MIQYSAKYGIMIDADRAKQGDVYFPELERKFHLWPRSFDILSYLMYHQGKFRTVEEILGVLWKKDESARARTVRVRMDHIRQALQRGGVDPKEALITRWHYGYMFNPDVPQDIRQKTGSVITGDFVTNEDYRRVFRLRQEMVVDSATEEPRVVEVVDEVIMRMNSYKLFVRGFVPGPDVLQPALNLMKAVWGKEVSTDSLTHEITALRAIIGERHIIMEGGKGGKPAEGYRFVP